MAPNFRTLTEDPDSVPNTHTRQLESTVTPVLQDLMAFLGTYALPMCGAGMHISIKNVNHNCM